MVRREELVGRWIHSHEEDTGDVKVFRPSTFAFPPSRGREALELKPDGSSVVRSPGPTDVPEDRSGRWELEGRTLRLGGAGEGDPARSIQVIAAEPDKLVVKE
jgi:hypothetical protein